MSEDLRLAYFESFLDNFFPPLLRRALELLAVHKIVRTERSLGPFLRDTLLRTERNTTELYEDFPQMIPVPEALALLRGLELLAIRIRSSMPGSHPRLETAIAQRDAHTIVLLAFEELSQVE
jgi:hypothetical protein